MQDMRRFTKSPHYIYKEMAGMQNEKKYNFSSVETGSYKLLYSNKHVEL
jgi:hypothetical protein